MDNVYNFYPQSENDYQIQAPANQLRFDNLALRIHKVKSLNSQNPLEPNCIYLVRVEDNEFKMVCTDLNGGVLINSDRGLSYAKQHSMAHIMSVGRRMK